MKIVTVVGARPQFIKAAAGLGIGRVIYVSCNPETLARDLKLFMKHGYRVKRLSPVDMFPLTDNLECCALLEIGRKKSEIQGDQKQKMV